MTEPEYTSVVASLDGEDPLKELHHRRMRHLTNPQESNAILFQPCRVRVLLVADGILSFNDEDLGLSDLIKALATPSNPYAQFEITVAHRENNDARLGANITEITRRIRNFRFDNPSHFGRDKYDQVWLFGALTSQRQGNAWTNKPADTELQAISDFMNNGGGVWAAGDHGALGSALGGHVPRVRTMRGWFHDVQDFAFAFADWNGDGYQDLIAIKKKNTASGRTEVHILSGASNFQKYLLQTHTRLPLTDENYEFAFIDYNGDRRPDLVAIKKRNTGGRTQIQILSGASNFQDYILETTNTALPETDHTYDILFTDWDGDGCPDLVAIKKSLTGTQSTEVHILSGASKFQQYLLQTGTALHETDLYSDFAFAFTRWERSARPDLMAIKKSRTGTRSTEVHILSGASNFQKFVFQSGTALHETDDTFDFGVFDRDGDQRPDLVAIKKSNTGTRSTEVHILSGASGFKSFILQVGTPLHETDVLLGGPYGEPPAPDMNSAHRRDTIRPGHVPPGGGPPVFEFNDQSDDIPQIIEPKFYGRFPHPLLCSPRGTIRVLPDHAHEGECREAYETDRVFNFGAGPIVEFPPGLPYRPRPLPEIIATSRVLAGNTSGGKFATVAQAFGPIGVYDGDLASVGRVVVASTWHHFLNINLTGTSTVPWPNPKSQGFLASTSGRAHYEEFKSYFRNIAMWLARRSQRTSMRLIGSWYALSTLRLVEAVTPGAPLRLEDATCAQVLMVGRHARDELDKFVGPSLSYGWSVDLVEPLVPPETYVQLDPWMPMRRKDTSGPLPWVNLEQLLDMAVGGAMLAAREVFIGPDKFDAKIAEERIGEVLQDGAARALRDGARSAEVSVREMDHLMKALGDAVSKTSKADGDSRAELELTEVGS